MFNYFGKKHRRISLYLSLVFTLFIVGLFFVHAENKPTVTPSLIVTPTPTPKNPRVIFTTSLGNIELELNTNKAPITVQNFLQYIDSGFYKDTLFHRTIPNFMIQGGGFTKGMVQKKTQPPIMNEAGNGLRNLRGTIAMARTPNINSATSQFFINVVDNPYLDHRDNISNSYGYCVFGKITKGMDIVDKIASVPTTTVGTYQNVPKQDVIILETKITK
jgi:peptidyl-prolyl cis-trans isomerase A (cyclophilin A)